MKRVFSLLIPFVILGAESSQVRAWQCARCITVTPVAELSTDVAPIVPSLNQSVLRTADGRYLVSHRFAEPPQIVAYDSSGTFLGLYSAQGGGPGEFGFGPSLFPGPQGTTWALDANRLVQFGPDFHHIHTRNLGTQFFVPNLLVLSDSAVVASVRTSRDSVYSVRMMNPAWIQTRVLERASNRYGLVLLAAAEGGGFWTLPINQSQLRRYSNRGEQNLSVEVTSPHFVPWDAPPESKGLVGYDIPPLVRHNGIYDPGRGRIVILTTVPDKHWKPTPSNRMYNPTERDENALLDTILSLVDVANGRTIGFKRADEYLTVVKGASNLVYTTRLDQNGHVITMIYRLDVP